MDANFSARQDIRRQLADALAANDARLAQALRLELRKLYPARQDKEPEPYAARFAGGW